MITFLGLKAKSRPKKYKKARYAIGNVSNKYLSNTIREFEKLPYEIYERNRPKNEPTDSYLHLARNIERCMMRADALNSHIYPERTKTTATKQIPTSHVCSTDKKELKEFLVDETSSQIFSTNEDKSKGIIVNRCSTEEDESECVHRNINKQNDANNETEYEEPSVQINCRAILTYSNVVGIF